MITYPRIHPFLGWPPNSPGCFCLCLELSRVTGVEARQDCFTGTVSPFNFGDVALGDNFMSLPSFRTWARRCFFVGNGSSSPMELLDRFCKTSHHHRKSQTLHYWDSVKTFLTLKESKVIHDFINITIQLTNEHREHPNICLFQQKLKYIYFAPTFVIKKNGIINKTWCRNITDFLVVH